MLKARSKKTEPVFNGGGPGPGGGHLGREEGQSQVA